VDDESYRNDEEWSDADLNLLIVNQRTKNFGESKPSPKQEIITNLKENFSGKDIYHRR